MQEKNIQHYAALIADDYLASGRDKEDIIHDVRGLFQMFDKIQMKTYNRTIRVLSQGHAECEQTYTLRAYADGQWRTITHREQLMLQHQDGVWKITAGL